MAETEDDDTITAQGLGAIMTLIMEQKAADVSMLSGVAMRVMAEKAAIMDGVRAALADAVWGGTTAQYEYTLERVSAALHPDSKIIDLYEAEPGKHHIQSIGGCA